MAVISQKEYASTSEIEELSNIKTQPTFSQHHMKTDKIISSNRENFSTAQSYQARLKNPQRFNAKLKSTQDF